MKTYYDLLELPATATLEEIKRNFRREIAKYHPDKVQHLGKEFQEIAAVKAAELTQAYKTLSDRTLRAEYDALIAVDAPADAHADSPAESPAPTSAETEPPRPESPPRAPHHDPIPTPQVSSFNQDRAASSDLIRRASELRFMQALQGEFSSFERVPLPGFEVAVVPKQSFWKMQAPPRILGRFVPQVDAAAVSESWSLASRMKKDAARDLVVFVMGPAVAPAGELAMAIADQRRRPMPAGGKLILVPTSTRNWAAHIPNDAPPVVKSLLTRLKTS